MLCAGPAVRRKVRPGEAARDDAHEYQELANRKKGNDQLKGRGNRNACDVQGRKNDICAYRGAAGIERRELDIEVGADRKPNRGWRKRELDQRREACDVAAHLPKGAVAVREWATGVGNSGSQFREAEYESRVHDRNEDGRDQKAEGAGKRPAVTPAEVLSGNDQSDRDAPEVQATQRFIKGGLALRHCPLPVVVPAPRANF